jgi:hypothetical protein
MEGTALKSLVKIEATISSLKAKARPESGIIQKDQPHTTARGVHELCQIDRL